MKSSSLNSNPDRSVTSLEAPAPKRSKPGGAQTCSGLTVPQSYTSAQIDQYLAEIPILETGKPVFDMVRFQSRLFSTFFKAVEHGTLQPSDPHYQRVALYLAKKVVELVVDLHRKVDKAHDDCLELCSNLDAAAVASHESAAPQAEAIRAFSERIRQACLNLDADIAKAVGPSDGQRPLVVSRERCVYLLFVIATLHDGAKATADWTARVKAGGEIEFTGFENAQALAARGTELLLNEQLDDPASPHSRMMSNCPLTEAEWTILDERMAGAIQIEDQVPMLVPCFSTSSAQGITAILDAIFAGGSLISGFFRTHGVHDNYYQGWHVDTMTHDTGHLSSMIANGVYSHFIEAFRPIYEKLAFTVASDLSAEELLQREKDLYVLFHILHEDPDMLSKSNANKTFLERARSKFDSTFEVIDTIKILNSFGSTIPAVSNESPKADKLACFAATAEAMNDLWLGFRSRHGAYLATTDFGLCLPRYFQE